MSELILKVEELTKIYQMGGVSVRALRGVSLEIKAGEFLVVVGPSGSGKSTLLNILGGMDLPTTGSVYYRGIDLATCTETELTGYRRNEVGFVFQLYNLMSSLTALENVELAAELVSNPLPAQEVLTRVGLAERMAHFPSQLSGGEQQRVAIARAVAKNPGLLLCDEPTGALDYETGVAILSLLQEINRVYRTTTVIITHNVAVADIGDRVLRMRSGQIIEVIENREPLPAERITW
jgi:putative ABC transport system ATP-binding protein